MEWEWAIQSTWEFQLLFLHHLIRKERIQFSPKVEEEFELKKANGISKEPPEEFVQNSEQVRERLLQMRRWNNYGGWGWGFLQWRKQGYHPCVSFMCTQTERLRLIVHLFRILSITTILLWNHAMVEMNSFRSF